MKLLARSESNTKLLKTAKGNLSVEIVGLSLSPANIAGGKTNCTGASAACVRACVGIACGLVTAFSLLMESRIQKTKYMQEHPEEFRKQLNDELRQETARAKRAGKQLVCRLNVFSDISWELAPWFIPQAHSTVRFYDYTKVRKRVGNTPDNYALCASWDERKTSQDACIRLLKRGHNVSVALYEVGPYAGNRAIKQRLPRRYQLQGTEFSVFDGDASDLRLPGLDPEPDYRGYGSVIGLRLKAGSNATREQAIESGFALPVE